MGRKLGLKGGRLIGHLLGTLKEYLSHDSRAPYHAELAAAVKSLEDATMWIAGKGMEDPEQAWSGSSPYLRLMALTVIAYLWSRMAAAAQQQLDAGEGNTPLLQASWCQHNTTLKSCCPRAAGCWRISSAAKTA